MATIGQCNELAIRLKRFECSLYVDVNTLCVVCTASTIWAIIWNDIVDVDSVLLLHRISVAFVFQTHTHKHTKWLVANRSMQSVCSDKNCEKVETKTQIKRKSRGKEKKSKNDRKIEKKKQKWIPTTRCKLGRNECYGKAVKNIWHFTLQRCEYVLVMPMCLLHGIIPFIR